MTLLGAPVLAQSEEPEETDLNALLEILSSDDPETHAAALDAIIALGAPSVPTLESIVVDGAAHPRQRAGAAFALGRIGVSSSQDVLSGLWDRGYEALGSGLAMQVAVALAELGELAPLRSVLEVGNDILAAKAAVQLGLRRDAEALAALQEAFSNEDYARLRPFFAIGLGLLGDDRGADLLRAGLQALELRNHCAVALAAVSEPSGLRFDLEFALEDVDPLVRLRALEALIAVDASNLGALLETASADPDARVRALAESASRDLRRRSRRR